MLSYWETTSVNHGEECTGLTSFFLKHTQNYSFPAAEVTVRASESAHVSFFFLLIVTSPPGTAPLTRAPAQGWIQGMLCWWLWGCTQRSGRPPVCGRKGARWDVCPRDCPSEPFSGAVWMLPSSSWHRITWYLITTTWWQPSEKTPSLNVMVWMPQPAWETLKWLLLETASAYQGKDHSINALFLTFFL